MRGDVYNAGSRESVSIAELARDVASAMGLNPQIRVTGEAHAGHVRSWEADITRLESLGFRAKIGYREGLADTVRWFRSIEVGV
jgi:nucleoside-diphosphate-sugar epimerase